MQFNYPEGRKPEPTPEVEVGNVYSSKNTHKTKAWLDVSRFDAAPLIAFTATKETDYGAETNGRVSR